MEAALEKPIPRKGMDISKMIRNGQDHLPQQLRIPLTLREGVPQHVPYTSNPAAKCNALFQFACGEDVLCHRFDEVPDVKRMLDDWHASVLPRLMQFQSINKHKVQSVLWIRNLSCSDSDPNSDLDLDSVLDCL